MGKPSRRQILMDALAAVQTKGTARYQYFLGGQCCAVGYILQACGITEEMLGPFNDSPISDLVGRSMVGQRLMEHGFNDNDLQDFIELQRLNDRVASERLVAKLEAMIVREVEREEVNDLGDREEVIRLMEELAGEGE